MQYQNGRGWREQITPPLTEMGITVFNPYSKPFVQNSDEDEPVHDQLQQWLNDGDYDRVAEKMKQIRNFDLRLCDISDFIIAQINPKVASWGSAEELVTSIRMKKPVFLSIEGGKQLTPFWILGMLPHKYIYNNVDEIINVLKKIDSGEKTIDSECWRLLRPEFR